DVAPSGGAVAIDADQPGSPFARTHTIVSDARTGRSETASAAISAGRRERKLDGAGAPTREDGRGPPGFDLDETPVNLVTLGIDLVGLSSIAVVDDLNLGLNLCGRFLAGHGASPSPLASGQYGEISRAIPMPSFKSPR